MLEFDVKYAGKVYAMNGGVLYTYRDGGFYGVAASATIDDQTYTNSYKVALTGYYAKSQKGNIGYQTTSGEYILLNEGWKEIGVQAVYSYSQSQAQALANKIIKNNSIILCNNLLCARYANKLTAEQQSTVRDLQRRLYSRNNALQSGGLTTNVKTSYPKGFAEFEPYLTKLMDGEAVGIATWVVVVIAVTVIAALSTAAYYAYKTLAEESEQDVKYSKELTAILAQKLTPEEYQQLLNETKGIVTKSKIRTLTSTFFGSPKMWLFVGIGIVGLLAFKELKKQYNYYTR